MIPSCKARLVDLSLTSEADQSKTAIMLIGIADIQSIIAPFCSAPKGNAHARRQTSTLRTLQTCSPEEVGTSSHSTYVAGEEQLAWFLAWSGRRDEALAELTSMAKLDFASSQRTAVESGVYYG